MQGKSEKQVQEYVFNTFPCDWQNCILKAQNHYEEEADREEKLASVSAARIFSCDSSFRNEELTVHITEADLTDDSVVVKVFNFF